MPPKSPLNRGARAGRFHSPKNEGFVGVVRPLLPVPTPPPTIFRHFRHWGNHGGIAPTKNETALCLKGDLDYATTVISH
jgi:hypothetical protein